MLMNNADEASTSRIVEIILRSIHRSDETSLEESMLFVELWSKERLQTALEVNAAASPPDVRYRLENQASVLKLDSSTPASPRDVRYRLENQASALKFDSSTPASPPDVRYRLENQASVLKLDSSTPASPPDVRRGFAPPYSWILRWGYAPGSGSALAFMGIARTRGVARSN